MHDCIRNVWYFHNGIFWGELHGIVALSVHGVAWNCTPHANPKSHGISAHSIETGISWNFMDLWYIPQHVQLKKPAHIPTQDCGTSQINPLIPSIDPSLWNSNTFHTTWNVMDWQGSVVHSIYNAEFHLRVVCHIHESARTCGTFHTTPTCVEIQPFPYKTCPGLARNCGIFHMNPLGRVKTELHPESMTIQLKSEFHVIAQHHGTIPYETQNSSITSPRDDFTDS